MPEPARSFSMTLRVTDVMPCPHDAEWVCCLHCGAPLELHQPDAEEPRRFVGTCKECNRWYLLDWMPPAGEGHMLLLPSYDELHTAFQASGA